MKKTTSPALILVVMAAGFAWTGLAQTKRPNVLLAITDAWFWPHAGIYGCKFVNTTVFDRIARKGMLFNRVAVAITSGPLRTQ